MLGYYINDSKQTWGVTASSSGYLFNVIFCDNLTEVYKNHSGFGDDTGLSGDRYAKKDGNTVYWYCTNSTSQFNYSGCKYYVLAIG